MKKLVIYPSELSRSILTSKQRILEKMIWEIPLYKTSSSVCDTAF